MHCVTLLSHAQVPAAGRTAPAGRNRGGPGRRRPRSAAQRGCWQTGHLTETSGQPLSGRCRPSPGHRLSHYPPLLRCCTERRWNTRWFRRATVARNQDVAVCSKKRPFHCSEICAELGMLGGTRTSNLLIHNYANICVKTMYTQIGPYVSVRRCTGPTQHVAVSGCGTRAIREGRYTAHSQGDNRAVTPVAMVLVDDPPRVQAVPLVNDPRRDHAGSVTAFFLRARAT
jgi:hypothetical protein